MTLDFIRGVGLHVSTIHKFIEYVVVQAGTFTINILWCCTSSWQESREILRLFVVLLSGVKAYLTTVCPFWCCFFLHKLVGKNSCCCVLLALKNGSWFDMELACYA